MRQSKTQLRAELSKEAGDYLVLSEKDPGRFGEMDEETKDYLSFLRDNPDSKIVKGLLRRFQEFDSQGPSSTIATHMGMHIDWIAHNGIPEYSE